MNKPKVVVHLKGGLGNQLFSYAASLRIALKNNAELVLDDVSGFISDWRYKRKPELHHFRVRARLATPWERLEPFHLLRRKIARLLVRGRDFTVRNHIEQEKLGFDERLLQVKVKNYLYIEGHWQSEKYFADIKNEVLKDFRIVAPEDALNQKTAEEIAQCNAVCVHFRWFSPEKGAGEGENMGLDYYKKAVSYISERVENPHFFVFSDDVEAVSRLDMWKNIPVSFVSHNKKSEDAYCDLWLMTKCRHFIIANSTFSWWGAWLSEHSSKIVVSPARDFYGQTTAWGFDGLIPDEWICL